MKAVAFAAVVALIGGTMALMLGTRLLGWQAVIVLSGSMEPALSTGGLAFMRPGVDPATVREGDIITFRSPSDEDQRISHRVVEIVQSDSGLSFRTKGDANPEPDANLVPADALAGRIQFHLPYLGHVAGKLRERYVFYLSAALTLCFFLIGRLTWRRGLA